MFDDVLVPTDGSDCADTALDYATDLAVRYDATVHVLSVVDSRAIDTGPHGEQERSRHENIADTASEELRAADIAVEEAVRTDLPHDAILEYADEHAIDLVVMGTHGRTGVERYLLGSVTEKVVRMSDVPVLTVREFDDGAVAYPYGDVLVPTDGSEGAMAAVDPAVDIARTYDAALHALTVIDTMQLGVDVPPEAFADALEENARTAVEDVATRARDASLDSVESTIEYGRPSSQIRSYVESNGVDLIVMGTHGRSGIERYLLGSVAEKLVRTAPVPVVVVPTPSADTE